MIAEELGVDPGAELQQLYQQILNADGDRPWSPSRRRLAGRSAPAPVPAQFPADIADFTGRADQVRAPRAAGRGRWRGQPRGGPRRGGGGRGGLGKTTLAVHTAHLLASEFPDGQLYVNLLGATQPAAPPEVLARFLRDLGRCRADPARRGGAGGAVPDQAGRQAGADRARRRQGRGAGPAAAARQRLVRGAGHRPPQAARAGREQGPRPRRAPAGRGRTLFVLVAAPERAVAEPEATDEVLTACAGLPLAIRIAGARLAARGGWTVRTLADRLADERRRLDELRAGNLAVRASFEVSFASLPGPELPGGVDPARAFRLLGLWPGGRSAWPPRPPCSASETPVPTRWTCWSTRTCWNPRRRTGTASTTCSASTPPTGPDPGDRGGPRGAVTRVLTWYLHTTEAAARIISAQHTRGAARTRRRSTVHPLRFATLDEALDWCEGERPDWWPPSGWPPSRAARDRLEAAGGRDELLLPAQPLGRLGGHARDRPGQRPGHRGPASRGLDAQQPRHGLRRAAHGESRSAASSRRWRLP